MSNPPPLVEMRDMFSGHTPMVLRPASALPAGSHRLSFFPMDPAVLDTCAVGTPRIADDGRRHLRDAFGVEIDARDRQP